MSLYRCAACGSPNVVTDIQKEGYNYVKGAIGTVILGAGGAVAGINGKTKQVYKCPDCGLTLNEPMSFEIKTLIDIGIASESAREKLEINGNKIEWESLISKYKNIENHSSFKTSSSSDSAVADYKKEHKDKTPDVDTITISPEQLEENKQIYETAKSEYIKLCEEWRKSVADLKQMRQTELAELMEQEKTKILNELTAKKVKELAEYKKVIGDLEQRKGQLEIELSKLGFLKFSAKKQINEELEKCANKIIEENRILSEISRKFENDKNSIESVVKNQKEALEEKVQRKYPYPLKPEKPAQLLKYKSNGAMCTAEDLAIECMKSEIFRFVESQGKYLSMIEIKNGTSLSELSDKKVLSILAEMEEAEELKLYNNKYNVRYELDPLKPQKRAGRSKYKSSDKRQTAVDLAIESMKDEVFEFLEAQEKYLSMEEIKNGTLLSELSDERVNRILAEMVEDKELILYNNKYNVK